MTKLIARVRRKGLNGALGAVFIISFLLMLKTTDDKLISGLANAKIERLFGRFATGNQIIFNISVGVIVSTFIYFLVVRFPERRKRTRIKRNLKHQYDLFKEDCITTFLDALQQPYDPELISELKDRDKFKNYFKESVTRAQNRWDAVYNRLDDYMLKRLLTELEILRNEILFTLAAIDIENDEVFSFLKRLSQVVYRIRNWSQHSDEREELFRFLWSVHTGWDVISGYREKDVIAETIEAI